jgi:DNA-binding response OmpR family regulator
MASDDTSIHRGSEGQRPGQSRMPDAAGATGKRVLVVEDEFLLAMQLEEELLAAGCTVLGPYKNLAEAMRALHGDSFQLAILDVNLSGEMVYPLADELAARGIPFVFLSGYGASNLPQRFRAAHRVSKPFDTPTLFKAIRQALSRQG